MRTCTHCGLIVSGATPAVWGEGEDREPFCSYYCMEAERAYRALLDNPPRS